MTCETCGAPTGWVPGHKLESACESKRAAMAECKELRTRLADMTAERDAERAKVAVLEVDAARYRWLRGNQDPGHRYLEMEVRAWSTDHQRRVWFVDVEPDDLDRRIDDSIARNALEKTR